jgi:DNA repair protein SbcD/Mre11
MRILHTSDWHLGHTLHDVPRDHEHDRFLGWLIDTLAAERIDALVIAGDVFETANPPASAQARWYGFLAQVRHRMPDLDVVVIGGNHDSAARLDAPVPLLEHMRIHIVGGLHEHRAPLARDQSIALECDRLVVPLHDASGEIAAYIAAVPFLRPSDLPRDLADPDDESRDPLVEGVRQVYARALDAARARCTGSQALLAAGHCYMVGTEISRLSERCILGGNQHALPVTIFPDDVAYVALGHLHKAQRVAGRDHVRYSGSPLPLSMYEAAYQHQVCVVELRGAELAGVRTLAVPRAVDMLRVPRHGAAPVEEVLAALEALEPWDGAEIETRPYLEVCARLSRPEPNLRQIVETALEGKRPRLLKLAIEYTGDGAALADLKVGENLRDLQPDEVFVRRYRRLHEGEPPDELLAAFHELLDQVQQGRAP